MTKSAITAIQKKKNLTASFYISGQDNKSQSITTAEHFKEAYSRHCKLDCITKREPISRPILGNTNRDMNFRIDSYDSTTKSYFGYIAVARDTFLPSMYNKTLQTETDFVLEDDQFVYERSYFLYYEDADILVFNNNRLGPRPDDLSYALTHDVAGTTIDFESIWNQKELQDVLRKGQSVKKCSVTVALPRNFKESQLDLQKSFSKTIVQMMSANGMSRLKLDFWGRASNNKSTLGYLSHDVAEGLMEFIDKFGNKQKATDPEIKKAELQPVGEGQKSENLLSQELKYKTTVDVEKGYPKFHDVKWALMKAYNSNIDTLKQYSADI
ncbi:DUF6731 family protein [Pseudoalteromonas fuliginea]|uniref:DUF6731 family protein n=1 Tax=Pseudoalteromonas TaxID=53246 RepID=UPI0002AADE7D|nr:DUF6731 family protein [Pseudoalteromonas sp. Bsw20308]ALQ07609.1 hypothetical protein D172_005680 [Pseudoalteromonas sp. Bsw20308]